jgi:hypothetical protein
MKVFLVEAAGARGEVGLVEGQARIAVLKPQMAQMEHRLPFPSAVLSGPPRFEIRALVCLFECFLRKACYGSWGRVLTWF